MKYKQAQDFFEDEPRWTTVDEIDDDIERNVSGWLLNWWRIEEELSPPKFTVIVKLYPWAWLWLGRKHKEIECRLQRRCNIGRPAGVMGTVVVK